MKIGDKVYLKKKARKDYYGNIDAIFDCHTCRGVADEKSVKSIVSCLIATMGIGEVVGKGSSLDEGRSGYYVKVNFRHVLDNKIYQYVAYFDPKDLKAVK